MVLTRSKDRKLISLANFNQNDKNGEYFKLLAWDTKLKPHYVSRELNDGISNYYATHKASFDSIVEIAFAGRCEYILLTYFELVQRSF